MRCIRTRTVAAFVALALASGLEVGASTRPGRFNVSIRAVLNSVEGSPIPLCQASRETGNNQRTEWWLAFGDTAATRPGSGVGTDEPSPGGCGLVEDSETDRAKPSGRPYLEARLSTSGRLISEGPLELSVSISLSRFSGFGTDGQPVYEESTTTRVFLLSRDSPDAVIPLLVASPEERDALGVREVILGLEASIVDERVSPYGIVRVVSDRVGADLLLDGGVVDQVIDDADTILRHVPAGLREVRAREPSGTAVRRVVRVVPGGTVAVDLSRPGTGATTSPYRLVPLGKNAKGHEEYRRAGDGAVVVKIPAGEFVMGNPETERQPLEHTVYVSEFLIDKTGVTWRQFKRFAAIAGVPLPPEPFWGMHDDHPVVFVSWEEGRAYCEWAGGRLPTEAEREKAARGTDKRMYPWGNEKPNAELAVHRRSWGFEATDPVGAHPRGASPYGVLDIAGNVWEWCMDWYDKDYYSVSPRRNPKGPPTGIAHVVRGGSWDSRPDVLSCSCRSFGNLGYREGDFGFRCAMNAPDSDAFPR